MSVRIRFDLWAEIATFWEYKRFGESSIRVIRVLRALSLARRGERWPIVAEPPVKLDVYKQNVIIGY